MNTKRSYCKRIFVLLMAFMMVFTMMPSGMFGSVDTAWADATQPTEISTAEEFAKMSVNGNYKLTEDITVSAPYNGTFSGTFDGDGHTVTVKINATYGNAGLFGATGNGASIKNVLVDAEITSSAASSSYGTGGLIGLVSGRTTIENCGVYGSVKNTSTSTSSGAYVGGLIGYIRANVVVNESFAACAVSNANKSSSASTGGLIGRTSNYYTLDVSNCYASGNVQANKGYAGGMTGYVYCSASYKHNYTNCYAAGKTEVTGVTTQNAFGFAYSYASAGFTFTNCYYNSDSNTAGFNKNDTAVSAKSTAELKALAADLGDAFQADTTNLNSGYPILSWQYIDPNAVCTISFELMPVDSVLTWNGTEQAVSESGIYSFDGVKVGEYTYNVVNEAGDYTTQSGTISVKGKAISKKINLELNRHNLAFTLMPSDAELTVKNGEDILETVSENTYSVVNGTYNYEVSSFGYKTKIGTVEVNRSDKTETISLQEQPITTVSFDFGDVNDISGGKIAVAEESGINMTAKENTDGKVFELPAGYKYSYNFTSGNYAKQRGTIDLTAVTDVQNETITLTMVPKTAWEGADDITEPAKDTDGVYQISSGSELAWLAAQINSGKNNTCSAVLTKDIDLGSEKWTAIGKSSSYSFKGKFDGQGYTVKNLNISGTSSANYGLFGYVDGGTIKNLTVEGEINISGSGSSSYGIGGIVGQLAGAGTIEQCINRVDVTGNYNTGGIVGYANGSVNKLVQSCVNEGTISGSSNVGGIGGQFYGAGTASNCYNRGNISASVGTAGGIIGYLYGSYSGKNTLFACYSTGDITNKSYSKAVVGRLYSTSYSRVTNCYYLNSATAPADTNATAKTSDELKALAATLGESFVTAPSNMNDGYPMLSFQIPTYELSFNVNDETATVAIEGQTGVHNGSTWTFKLPDGSYSYEVYAYGKISQNGVIEVKGAQVTQNITLVTADTKEISFKITPAEASAAVSVFFRGTVVDTETAGKYTLPYGSYTYQVKAKGYTKVTGTLIVSENSDAQITVNLIQTSAWDGETKTQASGNGTQTSPYLIEDGEMLAWFAELVNNASTSTELYAELTDDVDLGNNPWTPTGKDFHEFQGSFDGKGYTISGVNVSGVADAGLFGVVKNAEINNLTVSGSIIGIENAGGIVGKASSNCSFSNCGNEASVSGKYAAGIIGCKNAYSADCSISRCYNAGNITSEGTEYAGAGGIIASTKGNLAIDCCYNSGTISSEASAGGISATSIDTGASISNSYNSGTIKYSDMKEAGAISPGKNPSENCYYLAGSANDNIGSAKEVSAFELQKLELSDEFEHVSGINRDYPVLKWQGLKAIGGKATLAEDAEFIFEKVPLSVFSEGEEATNMLASTKLTWKAVSGADKYVITLWKQGFTDEGTLEISLAAAITDVSGTKDTNDESKLIYDCKAAFDELEEGVFYAAIVPMNADGSYIVPTREQLEDEVIGWVSPYDRLKKVTNLRWDDGRAYWDAKANFTEEDIYTINLYTVTYGDGGASGEPIYEFFRSYELEGNYSASDFRNIFAAETNYAFTIIAQTSQNYQVRYGLTDSPVSDMSPVYMAGTIDVPTEDHEDWIAISTAKQWVDLANVEDAPSVDGDSSSPSMQAVEWSKNYYLTADIDFSTLSAADQVKTKSIGNVTNRFLGTFDGNGHTIKGLTLSDNDAGLFWYVGSTGYIYDLKVENANVLFSDNAAVIAQMNFGKIEKCSVINCNITADVGAVLGGMVSRNYGIIRESYVQGGSLSSNSMSATGHAGFVGSSEEGGIIERCWTSMDVHTNSDYAGGFVGLGYGGTIRDCFALGDVSARGYSGGFAGRSVYGGNVYENCYAAGKVTVSGEEGHGFIGGNKPDSAFQNDQSEGIANCYYNAASPTDANGAVSKTADEMKESAFLTALNKNGCWSQEADKNSGLPYLTDVKVPEKAATSQITVELALASYDKESYEFSQMGDTISITMDSNGNTRLVDLMDEAVAQKKLTYEYDITTSYGRFIKTINGYSIESPDGWMFTVNDKLSNVSASLATVKNGDKVLWFEGTNENHFQGPTWEALENSQLTWIDISSVEQLKALASSSDAETLAKNYRLTADINLAGEAFSGIGSGTAPFTGIFDGQKHTVSNVKITSASSSEGTGFFNVIKGATVKNLKLTGVEVSGDKKVGALVGWAQVQLDSEDMTKNIANLIGNCTATGTVQGNEKVGGLVGVNDGKTDKDTLFSIESAMNKVGFDGKVVGKHQVGGLTGENGGAVTAAYAKGTAAAPEGVNDTSMIGGLVGDNTGSIYDSYADVKVNGYNVIGGFVGYSEGIVKNSYSLGSVSGSSNVGSFAGSISKAEYVIGAGQVTRTGTSSAGYAGGFAGNMGGSIVGVAAQITIKDAYGNCVGADGTTFEAVGNSSSFTSDAQKEVLAQMGLTSMKAVGEKLYEMFGVNLRGLEAEAEKYADTIKASENIAAGDIVSLLKTGCTADPEVEVSYSVSGDYLSGGESLKLVKENDTFAAISVKVDVKLSSDTLGTYNKKVNVIIPVSSAKLQEVMDNIAASYTESSDAWTSMDMIAYAGLKDKTISISETAKQNIKNSLINEAAESSATASDRSRIEIVLRALGVDTNRLYTANSKNKFSNASALKNMDFSNTAVYTAPYVLLADLQGNVKLSETQVKQLIGVIRDNSADGLFGYTYGGVKYDSPDTAGICLAALAKYADTDSDAKYVTDKIMAALPQALDEKGSFGNANADAIVITGLLAAGYDPYQIKNAGGCSVVDGLMSAVNSEGNAFLYLNWSTGETEVNALATEQGFRALVALRAYKENGSKAYNIYDYSKTAVSAAQATGSGTQQQPTPPSSDTNMAVYLTVKTDTETWLARTAVTVPTDATVYDAFVKAINDAGMAQEGAANGYVKSITNKNGETLAHFDKGQNSGWLYTVNEVLPNVTLTSYSLSEGDEILWYYTADYTKDPQASFAPPTEEAKEVTSDKAAGTTTSPTDVKLSEKTNADGTKESVATVTVSAENQKEILKQAKANKSKEIILQVSKDAVKDASKADIQLDKSFIESVLKDTEAKLTVKTPFGDKTYTQDELKALAAAAAGKTVSLEIVKSEKTDEELKAEQLEAAKTTVAKASMKARSTKTAKGNVKVVFKPDTKTQNFINEMKDMGYTVKYRFYRSTKKSSGYKAMLTKTSKTYTNTSGKAGTRYYYKVQVRVYDENGKCVAKTALKQCKYATRIFG